MAIQTGTVTRFAQIGVKEQLSNIIYNISPEDTPGMSNSKRGSAENTYVEWQQDSLATAGANAKIDGDDSMAGTTFAATTRVGNYCQISAKYPLVSDRARVVKTAGRSDELGYQIAKMSAELKRDMEFVMWGANTASAVGNSTTAPLTASMPAFLVTNTNIGAVGANPVTSISTARTDGTQRNFTEVILKDVQKQVWASGGNPSILMVGPVNKQRTSTFTGIATLYNPLAGNKPATIIGAASIYIGDFGTLTVVPNRFQRERDAWFLDPEYLEVCYLRPFKTVELAKTGDADKRMVLADYTLKVGTEKAHGGAFDLNIT